MCCSVLNWVNVKEKAMKSFLGPRQLNLVVKNGSVNSLSNNETQMGVRGLTSHSSGDKYLLKSEAKSYQRVSWRLFNVLQCIASLAAIYKKNWVYR